MKLLRAAIMRSCFLEGSFAPTSAILHKRFSSSPLILPSVKRTVNFQF